MIHRIHEIVWGPWLLLGFLGVGLYYTVSSGFFQIRRMKYWMGQTAGSIGVKEEIHKGKGKGVSQFQSACTALAATIGTGNIVGVAAALTAGGPGAVFWMWISALIGMMTAYGEACLGIHYRYKGRDGSYICGPMVYMDRGLGWPGMGAVYGFCCIMTALGMGSMVQANSFSETIQYSFQISPTVVGAALTLGVFAVIKGGIRRIASAAEKIMPLSAGIYFFFSMSVILSCYSRIPMIFMKIIHSAFELPAMFGGAAGVYISQSLKYGISRGVFSNEAGLGTLAILHGAAEDTTAEKQGMWAMFEVFVDTIVICTMTALVILLMTEGCPETAQIDGAALTAWCFSKRMGKMGEYLVSLSMCVFAFATITAWYYLGRQAMSYLSERFFAGKWTGEALYTGLYLNAVFWGCILKMEAVWEFADIWNGLLAMPNLLALIYLRKMVTGLDNRRKVFYTQKRFKA